ncbi:MAG: hypothetical protein IT165_15770 [Bryobacterales bacterium]|nr:hypothetical protein [Bryobacterales bacterium]
MPQLGILFDSQKLGSGFYGYTAFRILFTVAPPRELAGSTLYHGEIGDGRARPYCIAIETENAALLGKIRHMFASSMARGLMPASERFADEMALQEEVLALAARITSAGEMVECHSRWLQEAWQRGQSYGPVTLSEPSRPAARPPAEVRASPRVPDKAPLAVRISPAGRKAFALLLAFSTAGALVPWLGWGLAACAMVFVAGVVQGFAIRWRMWVEEGTLESDAVQETRRLLTAKAVGETSERLGGEAAQASPLLRRIQATLKTGDMAGACLLAEQHEQADQHSLRGDVHEIRMHAWGVAAVAVCSLSAMAVFQGTRSMNVEMPRLVLAGVTGFVLLQWMASLLLVGGERMLGAIRREMGSVWLPLLSSAIPAQKAQFQGIEKAMQELTQEFQAMRGALERRRDGEFVETMADLRRTIDQLTPVLAGFREPFVLQAVPAPVARPKVMGATA